MISRQGESTLYKHAVNVYGSCKPSARSWFSQVAQLCLTYKLPHPIQFLLCPPAKVTFKTLIKARITDFWEQKLRCDAVNLSSLKYFKSEFYSLKHPHPILSSAGSNSYEVQKANLQTRLLCQTYNCENRCRHWSKSNPNGYCTAPSCLGSDIHVKGDIHHILATCPSLDMTRTKMLSYMLSYSQNVHEIKDIVNTYCSPSHPDFVQFMLDCSALPDVIRLSQEHGTCIKDSLFKITRTFTYSMHRARMSFQN